MSDKCELCKYFQINGNGSGAGDCRINPPIASVEDGSLFPRVYIGDWCGQFAEKDKTPKIRCIDEEMAVLGAMFIDRDAASYCVNRLKPEHFYREINRLVFDAMKGLIVAGGEADLLSVTGLVKNVDDKFDVSYLAQLVDYVPTAKYISDYCDAVQESAELRKIIVSHRDKMLLSLSD